LRGWFLEGKEVVITHETLFEILKREKERTELQKLDDDFFTDVVSYIKEKKKVVNQNDELFSVDDKLKTEKQISNIRRILKDLYDKREKKIINMALDRSRTKSDVIDTSTLLKEEKAFFEYLVGLFNRFREGVLYNLLNESLPIVEEKQAQVEENKEQPEAENKIEEKPKVETNKDSKLVRFTNAVPKFVGKELEEYGPFEEEDVATLPNEIAEVLILKGRVEEINEG
jgi:DNA replication initiation complex subunit (GINS family)